MNKYIKDICYLINNGSMDNTYKMSWIRSIVEICERQTKKKIYFDELSYLIFKYYWDQSIFFQLNQSPNRKKKPEIIQLVEKEITNFKEKYGNVPKKFLSVEDKVSVPIKKISTILKYDVSHRFLNLGNKKFDIYEYDLENRFINVLNPHIIKIHCDVLYQLINYRWTQKLEEVDGSPRLSKKIIGVDKDNKPKRKSLKNFRQYLDLENPTRKCFITGEKINDEDLSIDHVIPWSYMFSNDIWNLVYVKKSLNSSKNNRLPNEDEIERLDKRNKDLLSIMNLKGIKNKFFDELDLSIERDYLRHHYIGVKG